MVTVEDLYKNFGILADAKDKAAEHEEEYKAILSATKGGPSEKRLACQFIPRFFKYFPALAEQAIDAQLDLCEDEDISIRKQAIKELPSFCKGMPQHLPRIADIITQLLQSDDQGELAVVQQSLISLYKIDAKGALGGLFSQILQGEELVRERAIRFMANKLKSLPEEIFTKEVDEFLVAETKKVLVDVTGDEFVLFMKILAGVNSMQTLQGRQQLVEIITEQADLDKAFDATDPDCVDRLIACSRQVLPHLSKNVLSTKFVAYMCDQVIPVLNEVVNPDEEVAEGEEASETPNVDLQLDLLKIFAEMTHHCGEMEDTEDKVGKVYAKLLEYMPLPPSEENGENTTPNTEPKLQFSYVECLMYAFHQLASKCPHFLTAEDEAERLKDFRIRLQYFARGVQLYIKQLKMSLQGKTGDQLKTEENKIKVAALKITSNINTLIKDLFHNPPSYKALVHLSWKPHQKTSAATVTSPGQKRPGYIPITYDADRAKKARDSRQMYAPPQGKWSDNAGHYTPGSRGQSRGRGYRGGWRGNRGGRIWRGGRGGNRW